MNLLNKAQLTIINVLFNKLHIDADEKESILLGFSGGRTVSTRELTSDEAIALIRHLKNLDPEEKRAEKMRRKIISQAHEMGWHIKGTHKVDMKHLDEWCVKFGYLHKKLNQYQYKELPKLVTQFEMAYKHYLSGL